MICATCNQDAIENTALGKSFWYCRGCKVEVTFGSGKTDNPKSDDYIDDNEYPWGVYLSSSYGPTSKSDNCQHAWAYFPAYGASQCSNCGDIKSDLDVAARTGGTLPVLASPPQFSWPAVLKEPTTSRLTLCSSPGCHLCAE